MRGRLAEHRGLWQEEAGDDYPMVPVRAHGGRKETGGNRSGPSKSCDDVISDLRFAEVTPHTHPLDPSAERSQMGHSC